MNDSETATTLRALRSLHDTAAEMADSATRILGDGELVGRTGAFADDHRRSSADLARISSGRLERAGSPVPGIEELTREQMRLTREAASADEVLEVMLLMEEVIASQQGLASTMELPDDIAAALDEQIAVERSHVSALQDRVGTLPVEVTGGGVSTDHIFVDDKNPDDFEAPEPFSGPH